MSATARPRLRRDRRLNRLISVSGCGRLYRDFGERKKNGRCFADPADCCRPGYREIIADLTCAGLTSRSGAAHYDLENRDSRNRAVIRFYLRLSGGKTAKIENRGYLGRCRFNVGQTGRRKLNRKRGQAHRSGRPERLC